jgi:hypothetical protein
VDFLNRNLAHFMLALALTACVPDRDDDESKVDAPRVIAIQMDPAEVAPRQRFTLRALYAGGDSADLDWAFCGEQKPLSELGPISRECLAPDGSGLAEPFANGLEAGGTMPPDACRLFGPDRPPPKDGEPAGRPVDPDPSGGYYQPIALFDYGEDSASLYEARVSCSLPGVTREQFTEWTQNYVRNRNPEIDAIDVTIGREVQPLDFEGEPLVVRRGRAAELRVWAPACGREVDPDAACGGAEPYLYFDVGKREIVTRRETLRASWFAEAGSFRDSRTELGRNADGSSSTNVWTAPSRAATVRMWVVLRDDRGGVAWRTYTFQVE